MHAISIKFVINDGTEEFCGPVGSSYISLIPQDDSSAENTLVYLAASVRDNVQAADGEAFYLSAITAYYLDLNLLSSTQKTDYLAKTGGTFTDPLDGVTPSDSSWLDHRDADRFWHNLSASLDGNTYNTADTVNY